MSKAHFKTLALVGSFAVVLASASVSAQITIKIPKIPKITKEKPQSGTEAGDKKSNIPASPDRTVSPTSGSPSTGINGKVRGTPIPGAKITFSNNPDGSNPKTSFTSSEFIYGRLDLAGKTVYDVFNLKHLADAKFFHIRYHVNMLKPGKQPEDHWGNYHDYIFMTKEDAQKTFWNFDVLVDPAKVTTIAGQIENDLSTFRSAGGIYRDIYSVDNARELFPESGTYTAEVIIYAEAYDDWGKRTNERKDYPAASAAFAFQFSLAEGQTLVANAKKAHETATVARNNMEMLRTMPDWWAKGRPPKDAVLQPAQLTPKLKALATRNGGTYLTHIVWPYDGGLWRVFTNDLGIPTYRYADTTIYMIYKDNKDGTCHIGSYGLRQDYAGGGTYQTSSYLSYGPQRYYIDCAAVR